MDSCQIPRGTQWHDERQMTHRCIPKWNPYQTVFKDFRDFLSEYGKVRIEGLRGWWNSDNLPSVFVFSIVRSFSKAFHGFLKNRDPNFFENFIRYCNNIVYHYHYRDSRTLSARSVRVYFTWAHQRAPSGAWIPDREYRYRYMGHNMVIVNLSMKNGLGFHKSNLDPKFKR